MLPTIGWQLDPFGHSSTNAALMTGALGFDATFFGRADYQVGHASTEILTGSVTIAMSSKRSCDLLWLDMGSGSMHIHIICAEPQSRTQLTG